MRICDVGTTTPVAPSARTWIPRSLTRRAITISDRTMVVKPGNERDTTTTLCHPALPGAERLGEDDSLVAPAHRG